MMRESISIDFKLLRFSPPPVKSIKSKTFAFSARLALSMIDRPQSAFDNTKRSLIQGNQLKMNERENEKTRMEEEGREIDQFA